MPFKEITRPYLKELVLLCVEDSLTIRTIYKSLFEHLFKEVLFAIDGEEAQPLFSQADIIITDYQMPKMNGLEFTAFVREKDQSIPIILVTAFEDIEVLRDAIQLGISNFVKKPFEAKDILVAINSAVELVIGHKFLLREQDNLINDLKEKEQYSNYQEELSFKKELSIVRNDFYYRLSNQKTSNSFYLADFLYQPLDTMSGDLYSARQLSNSQELYFLVDGMGKGISASVSAILFTSFVNYVIDRVLLYEKSFELSRLVDSSISYMNAHLLEDEVIAASFVLIDAHHMKVEYAAFGMPAILLMDDNAKVHSLPSNNPPISQYSSKGTCSLFLLNGMRKMLILSDGIHENSIKGSNETYAEYIEEDFCASMTRQDLYTRMMDKIETQEDDMTFILLHQINLNRQNAKVSIPAKYEEVKGLNEWYEEQVAELCDNISTQTRASLSFTELLMNAYEHGCLNVSSELKHKLMDEDKYFDYLKTEEAKLSKKIEVSIYTVDNFSGESYLLTKIEDNGMGFDTHIFSEIFGFHKSFNGRGVFIAKKSSLGIYYNYNGNAVYFLNKI